MCQLIVTTGQEYEWMFWHTETNELFVSELLRRTEKFSELGRKIHDQNVKLNKQQFPLHFLALMGSNLLRKNVTLCMKWSDLNSMNSNLLRKNQKLMLFASISKDRK